METKILDEILGTKWKHLGKWVEPALAAETWLEYGLVAQQFFKIKLDNKILYLNGDFFLSEHDSVIYINESYDAAKRQDREFFQKIYDSVKKISDELVIKVKNINSVTDFLNEYKQLTGVWMPLNNIAIGIEKYVQEINPELLTLTKGFLDEKPWTLQQIDEMKELKEEDFESHVNKYIWLGTHHFNIHTFSIDELKEKIKQIKSENKEPVSVNEKANEYSLWLLDLIGFTRFKAAETSGYITYYLKDYLEKIANEKGMSYLDIVEHTISEIANRNLSSATVLNRKNNTGFYFNGTEYLLTTEETKKCTDLLLLKDTHQEIKEFKGTIAQKGKAIGKVKIVTRRDQTEGFEDGMILVAYETTPDIIFAMQKSAAIVTDFGGLTSHAGIVARELKKPCIVGTKIATKVLKDGDIVEVDANTGTVRIIK